MVRALLVIMFLILGVASNYFLQALQIDARLAGLIVGAVTFVLIFAVLVPSDAWHQLNALLGPTWAVPRGLVRTFGYRLYSHLWARDLGGVLADLDIGKVTITPPPPIPMTVGKEGRITVTISTLTAAELLGLVSQPEETETIKVADYMSVVLDASPRTGVTKLPTSRARPFVFDGPHESVVDALQPMTCYCAGSVGAG